MKRSKDRILTTHVGKLPAPADLAEQMQADLQERPKDATFAARLRTAVAEVVRQQAETGIDVVNDGELGKTSWNSYLTSRLGGYEQRPLPPGERLAGREAAARESPLSGIH